MEVVIYVVCLIISIFLCSTTDHHHVFAFDSVPMQDFCVADKQNPAYTSASGVKPCKDPKSVMASDFYHSGLNIPGITNATFKVALSPVGVESVPGLNTMGMSMARLDLEKDGIFPLHVHHKATELHIVLKGCLGVGFVSSQSSDYSLYEKNLQEGDMFVVPMGLVHYQRNCGNVKTSSYAVLNSQNPGINSISRAVFGSKTPIDAKYLSTAYQLDIKIIRGLQSKHWV